MTFEELSELRSEEKRVVEAIEYLRMRQNAGGLNSLQQLAFSTNQKKLREIRAQIKEGENGMRRYARQGQMSLYDKVAARERGLL